MPGSSTMGVLLSRYRCAFEWRIMMLESSPSSFASAWGSRRRHGSLMQRPQKPSSCAALKGLTRRKLSSPSRSSMPVQSGVPLIIQRSSPGSFSQRFESIVPQERTSCISSRQSRFQPILRSTLRSRSTCVYVLTTMSIFERRSRSSACILVPRGSSRCTSYRSTSPLGPTDFSISRIHCETSAVGTTISVQAVGSSFACCASRGSTLPTTPRVASTRETTSSVLPRPISSQSSPPKFTAGGSGRSSPRLGE